MRWNILQKGSLWDTTLIRMLWHMRALIPLNYCTLEDKLGLSKKPESETLNFMLSFLFRILRPPLPTGSEFRYVFSPHRITLHAILYHVSLHCGFIIPCSITIYAYTSGPNSCILSRVSYAKRQEIVWLSVLNDYLLDNYSLHSQVQLSTLITSSDLSCSMLNILAP